MLQKLIVSSFQYLQKKPIIFFSSLTAICVVLGIGISRINISQEIKHILPKGEQFDNFSKLIDNSEINDQIIFQIKSKDNEEITYNIVQSLVDSLEAIGFDQIRYDFNEAQSAWYDYHYNYFPYLISSDYYQKIEKKLSPDSIDSSIDQVFSTLTSPGGSYVKNFVLNDPLFITKDLFQSYAKNKDPNFSVVNDLMNSTKDGSTIITTTYPKQTGVAPKELKSKLDSFAQNWNKGQNSTLDYFGVFLIELANSEQVRKDSALTIGITVIAILIILFGSYRRFSTPFFFLIPGAFGFLFALGIAGFISPKISALSLGAAAIIIGIILDYSFHFFTHYNHTGSLKETIKEISEPLLTGSVTTILAFAALMYSNSKILVDFGLIATLSLFASAIFTLFALPIFLKYFGYKPSTSEQEKSWSIEVPQKLKAPALITIILLTIFFSFYAGDISFDGQISHLGYHPQELKKKEQSLASIDPNKERKVYFFSEGNQKQNSNYELAMILDSLQKSNITKSYISTGEYSIPDKVIDSKKEIWKAFWKEHQSSLEYFKQKASEKGFSINAFNTFFNLIEANDQLEKADFERLNLTSLITKERTITTVIVPVEQLDILRQSTSNIEGVTFFSKQDLATELLSNVQDDFNYLLIASSSIVFIVLLIIYGRIELTLIAFVPMVIAWVWILGIATIFGIEFNFVNIILTTFIFGLGDDFSIFITDGLLAKYKTGKKHLASFQKGILLSGATTLIGTGVLIFAKHPSIHSIALISVLGIVCILFISLIIQPILFDFFFQDRIDQRKAPITFSSLLFSIISFSFFGILSTTLIPVSFTVALLPIPMKAKRNIINWINSLLLKCQVKSAFHIKKQIIGKDNLDFKKPSIIIANHSSFIDILILLALSPKSVMMVKDWVYNSPFFGFVIRKAGYLYSEDDNESNLKKAKELVEQGYSIIIFPEGSRSEDNKLKRFKKGAFLLAQELKLDITPVIIHGLSDILSKGDFIIKKGKITLKVLDRILFTDDSWGTSYQERTKSISKHFKSSYKELREETEDADYLFPNILRNYIFKGPTLEWYFRVKWRFEKKNFEYYDDIIENRKTIIDVGCGYGYLSYFLQYRDEGRTITGIDYDEEKIEVANNSYNLKNITNFISADIVGYEFSKSDVIIFNDVLHYLPLNDQEEVLNQANKSLNENGILIIRDGVTDYGDRHQETLKTEKYSTQIIGFNKSERELSFHSSEFFKSFSSKNNLSFELIQQSQKTSNVLFVLKKQ